MFNVIHIQGWGLESDGKTKEAISAAHFADACVRPLSIGEPISGRVTFLSRGQTMHMKVHSELGCAPKRADHMVTAYAAMEVQDTSMLLMIHTG